MSDNFPPKTKYESETQVFIKVLSSVVKDHSAIYVSSPITTGLLWVDWCKKHKDETDFKLNVSSKIYKKQVVAANLAAAAKVVERFREKCAEILIDPSAVEDLENWEQDDYLDLWVRVIENYASRVVFVNGWNFSKGCAYEFYAAKKQNVLTLDEEEQSISLAQGIEKVQKAIDEMKSCQMNTEFHNAVLSNLSGLIKNEEV